MRVTAPGSAARNPAFDMTPARFVTGYVTEQGVFAPGELPAVVLPRRPAPAV